MSMFDIGNILNTGGVLAATGLGIPAAATLLGAGDSILPYANFGLQFANYQYQKDLQNKIFSREDSSIQRRVLDLKAAGLSPVLAAGSGAGAGAVVHTNAPQVDRSETAQNVMALLTMEKDFQVKDQQLQLMRSQKDKVDIESLIKAWDYERYVESGMASNASGLAKAIRDIYGLTTESETGKSIIQPVVKQLAKKIEQNKTDYNKRQEKRIDKVKTEWNKPLMQRIKENAKKQFLGK